MPQFFRPKRRRANTGPNKNEKKVMRGHEAERMARTSGLLKDRFPHVERLSVRMEFTTPQQLVLDQQTRVFGPNDPCDFQVACLGQCGGRGTFDLTAKIQSAAEGRSSRTEGNGVCREPLYAGSSEICNFRLQCKIEVDYLEE